LIVSYRYWRAKAIKAAFATKLGIELHQIIINQYFTAISSRLIALFYGVR